MCRFCKCFRLILRFKPRFCEKEVVTVLECWFLLSVLERRFQSFASMLLTPAVVLMIPFLSGCPVSNENKTGAVLSRAIYSPCGQTFLSAPEEGPDYSFTGYEKDEALSFLDADARMFNATLCQFNSIDPIDPIGESAYAYARGNPLRYTDPTGRQAEEGQGCPKCPDRGIYQVPEVVVEADLPREDEISVDRRLYDSGQVRVAYVAGLPRSMFLTFPGAELALNPEDTVPRVLILRPMATGALDDAFFEPSDVSPEGVMKAGLGIAKAGMTFFGGVAIKQVSKKVSQETVEKVVQEWAEHGLEHPDKGLHFRRNLGGGVIELGFNKTGRIFVTRASQLLDDATARQVVVIVQHAFYKSDLSSKAYSKTIEKIVKNVKFSK